ncbi:MAG: LysR family transcriptional regulator [Oceanicoccus sp.]
MLDINAMLLFARVVAAQSYTQAAKDTGIPKSTLSRKIAQLEEHLDVRLLQRNSRSLSLTDEGSQVYEKALNILREVEAVELSVESARQDVSGTLRVLFPISFDQNIATSLCAGFLKKYPKIETVLQFSDGDVDLISQNFDIAVAFGPLSSSNLIAKPLFQRDMILVASPAYLEKQGTPTAIADLAEHQGILLGNNYSMPIWPMGTGTQKSLVSFHPKACVNSAAAVKQLVMADLGIAMLSESQCKLEIQRGTLVQILKEFPLEPLKAYGLYSSRNQLSPRISCFLDYVNQSFGQAESQQLLRLTPVRGLS